MKKCRFTIITSIILTCTMAFTGAVVFAASKSETQQELNEGQQQSEALQDEIDSLQDEIDEAQAKVDDLNSEVEKTQSDINETEAELEAQEDELEESREQMDERIRNMYKNGTVGFIDVLLSSDNVKEFISNLDVVKRIYTGDKNMIDDLQDQYDAIEAKKEELSEQKAQLDEQVTELTEEQADLNEELSEKSTAKYQIDENNKNLEKSIEEMNASYKASNYSSSSGDYTGKKSSGAFTWPTPGHTTISGSYGYRICPYHGAEKHSGIDISAPSGAKVVAAANGKVVEAGWHSSYGNFVLISHGNGLYTLYAHNSKLLVSAGQTVKKGQQIAKVGSTGNSTGPHCHFEVRTSRSYGSDVNPLSYL